MAKQMTIADITHPRYDLRYREWQKWRLTYHGGPQFIDQYLKQYTKRESFEDFNIRKSITYNPGFAAASVDEVKNSIYQRMADIARDGGSPSYHRACQGLDHGVDLLGNTMTSFIGQHVLPELLTMGRVGVYVDMPQLEGETILALGNKRPYIYLYETEDIRSWTYDDSNAPNEFGSLLLRDYIYVYDEETGLPKQQKSRFRHYWLQEDLTTGKNTVWCQFYSEEGNQIDQFGSENGPPINLNIDRIPFVILELNDSLLRDIANYQIALLNLDSSDLSFVLKANYPFYVEQYDPRTQSAYLRPAIQDGGEASTAQQSGQEEINTGISQGRRFPIGTIAPSFIHPSPEPLKASMEKQEQIKEEMRLLLHLAISNLQPGSGPQSGEAKGFDERGLEAGLSSIGLELEVAERLIASYWANYEGKIAASIKYPDKYNLKTDTERITEAESTGKLIPLVSSKTYQKEMAKRVSRIMLGGRLSEATLQLIDNEIDAAPAVYGDPQSITMDVTSGLVDLETASVARGYPPGSAGKASKDHAERLQRIAESQATGKGITSVANSGARGVQDTDGSGKSASEEKAASRDSTTKDTADSGVRGKGKATSKN